MPSPPPCAGCKHLRRRCVASCAFASYFPPEHGDQFAAVHKVFGASNVSKLLAEVAPGDRAGAVESLVYEATARLRDPAFGCASYITVLEHVLKQGMADVAAARGELAAHVGAAAAFRPFDAASASPEARRAGEEKLDAALRFAKEQDEKMRAVRAALDAKRKQGSVVAWKDGGKRGHGQPLLNRQMAEAQSAREQAVIAQQHGHRAVTGQGVPEGHPHQQIAEASESAAAAQAAREQAMMARQAAAAQQQRHHVVAQNGTGLAFPDGRVRGNPRHQTVQQIADAQPAEAEMLATSAAASWEKQEMKMRAVRGDELYYHPAMGREHPNPSQLHMANAKQLAAAEDVAWEQELMLRQAAAAVTGDQNMSTMMQQDAAAAADFTRDPNVMMMLQQAVGGKQQQHQVEQYAAMVQQIANGQQQLSAAAELVAREKQDLMTVQQQQQAAAYAQHAMPGSISGAMVAFQPGGSADAEAFLVQHQPLLQPLLAELPREQENDGGDDDGQLSDLAAYFGIPGPSLPPDGRGSS